MAPANICLFSLNSAHAYAEQVAQHLGAPLCAHEEREFEDGEHKSRPLVSVRGKEVYVVQSLYSEPCQSVNDKLCRLLFFLGALRDASARSVTAVVPYLCYARKDQKSTPRDPVTTRYVAAMFEAVGVDRVVTLDVHNLSAFQNAFRCHTDHLDARAIFVGHFAAQIGSGALAVVSPDSGGVKRAERFRAGLARALGRDIPLALMEKHRSSGTVTGELLIGDVRGRTAIIVDDLISTGTTLVRAARACRAQGAQAVYAAATHGLFAPAANEILGDPALTQIVVTDTIAGGRLVSEAAHAKLVVLESSPLVAQAIARIAGGDSLVELLEN
jgi:ribose-phosphate pyrophosphokinase